MRTNRRLTLKRESLSELSTDDLAGVAGGTLAKTAESCTGPITDLRPTGLGCFSWPLIDCVTHLYVNPTNGCL